MKNQNTMVGMLLSFLVVITIFGCGGNDTVATPNKLTLSVVSNGKFRWDFRPLAPSADFHGFEQADNFPAPEFDGITDVSLNVHRGPTDRPLKLEGSLSREKGRSIRFDGKLSIMEPTCITIEGLTGMELRIDNQTSTNGRQLLPGEYNLTLSGVAK